MESSDGQEATFNIHFLVRKKGRRLLYSGRPICMAINEEKRLRRRAGSEIRTSVAHAAELAEESERIE